MKRLWFVFIAFSVSCSAATYPIGLMKPGGPFTPASITGIMVWLDANTLSGSNGSVVSTWPDVSGNGHAGSGSGSNLTLVASAVNGKKAVAFAGDTFSLSGITSYSTYSYFIVYKQNGDGSPVIAGSSGSAYVRLQSADPEAVQLACSGGADLYQDINPPNTYGALGFTRNGGSNTVYLNGGKLTPVSQDVSGNQDFSNVGGFSSFVLSGNVAEVIMYNRALSDSEVKSVSAYLNVKYAFTAKKLVMCEGDSLTKGVGGTAWPTQLHSTLGVSYQVINDGEAGDKLTDMSTQGPSRIDIYFGQVRPLNLLVVWGGTNDFGGDLVDATTAYNRLVTYCNARKAAGVSKIMVLTCVARNGFTSINEESQRVAFNSMINANFATFADAVCDVAALPQFDQESDTSNTTYYFDGTHLTTTGYGLIRDAVVSTMTANGW